MRHVLNELLCLLFIHNFETVEIKDDYETVVCEQCSTVWVVDHAQHTMQPLKAVT
jgi:hypothetical protein